jgi:hypothetical protein
MGSGHYDTDYVPPCPRKLGGNEIDPNGVEAHTPGAKLDAGKPRVGLMFDGFSRALLAVAEVTTIGAEKYSQGGWQYVANGVARYTDAMDRHRLAENAEGVYDAGPQGTGCRHAAQVAWNALARLELMLREVEK